MFSRQTSYNEANERHAHLRGTGHHLRLEQLPTRLRKLRHPRATADPIFDPYATGTKVLSFRRTAFSNATGVREQLNDCTHWLDASFLYGITKTAADRLRTFVDGKLNNSIWEPVVGFKPVPNPGLWKTRGDSRVNKTPEMVAISDVLGLEHNRLCDQFKAMNPSWNDEQLYQEARKWVIAFWQKVVTREWLATLTGLPLDPYTGYNPNVNPSIENFFATAAFRYGHPEVNSIVPRVDASYQEIQAGHILMRDAYWVPQRIEAEGIENILRGTTINTQGYVSTTMVDDLRNYMFTPPPNSSDLGATNIQRGRDHGLPSYNDALRALSLTAHADFTTISDDPQIIADLQALYASVDDIDPYVGGLAEIKNPGSNLGPLFQTVIKNQFQRLRDGDRYWYEAPDMFTADELAEIYNTTLAKIIMRNTDVVMSDDAFWLSTRQLANFGRNEEVSILWPYVGEYDNYVDLSSSYRLSWTYDSSADIIHYMIQSFSSGWIGLGLYSDPGTMKNADIVTCRLVNNATGQWEIADSYALDVGKPAQDVTLGGTDDLIDTSGEYRNGITTCRFSKPRATGDQWDKPVLDGLAKVIFAFHPTLSDLVYHGPTRSSSAQIDLVGCTSGCGDGVDTGTIVGAVVGSVIGALLLLLIALLLALLIILRMRRNKKEKQPILAESWSDIDSSMESAEEDSESLTMRELSARTLSVDDLEGLHITVEPEQLLFGLDVHDKFPVDKKLTDQIKLRNTGRSRKFTFYVPSDADRFLCNLYPGTGTVKMGETITITVEMTLLMTTNLDRKIKLDIEGVGTHLISISLIGELSTRLDPDDIVVIPPAIGSGSFGTVYKANYRGSEVAAKMLNHQMDLRLLNEFKREVEVMSTLRSPYILHFVGASFVRGKVCLVSEYCAKGSLGRFIKSKKPFNYLLKLKVAVDMAKGINFLATNGIIARGVKP